MNWDAIGAVGEIVGALAVVGTLAYLAVQIRHNTAMTRASIRQARVDWSLEWATAVANSEYLPAIYVKLLEEQELTPEEHVRWVGVQQAWHRNLEGALLQQKDGLLDQEVLQGQREVLVDESSRKALLYQWDIMSSKFDPRYRAFVDSATSLEIKQ